MARAYNSEADKCRDLPQIMKYLQGTVLDVACGGDKVVPHAVGVDARNLPGVDIVTSDIYNLSEEVEDEIGDQQFDAVFSSHFIEHVANPFTVIEELWDLIKVGGHLVLYLPDGDHYDNKSNPEHMQDMKYEPFMFWFRRCWCGEGKYWDGGTIGPFFELVDHGLDVGEDRYSFYVIARKL